MTEPQEHMQMVQPQPSPETWLTNVHDGFVIITVAGVSGTRVSFLTADNAMAIGEQISNAGRRARSGLIIPQSGPFTPPSLGSNGGPQ